jgi:hypothetical protein
LIRSATLTAALLAAAPATAQNGAMWVDAQGRMMSLTFAGGSGLPPASAATDPAQMVALFKDVCVAGSASAAAVAPAAEARSLTKVPFEMGGKNAPVAGVWTGQGVVVSQADAFLGNKAAQCNATFFVDALPAKDKVVEAMTAALGAPPTNADKAIDKKGRPAKWWDPQWTVTAPDGSPLTAVIFVAKGNEYMRGDRVQLSLYAAKKGR